MSDFERGDEVRIDTTFKVYEEWYDEEFDEDYVEVYYPGTDAQEHTYFTVEKSEVDEL